MAVVTKHLTEAAVPVHVVNPKVSQGVSAVVGTMMAKEPAARYVTPTQLLEDLELVADGRKPKHTDARPPAKPPSQTDTLIGHVDAPSSPGRAATGGVGRKVILLATVGAAVVALGLVGVIVFVVGGGRPELENIENTETVEKGGSPRGDEAGAAAAAEAERQALLKEALVREADEKIAEVRGLVAARRFADARARLQEARPRIEAAGKAAGADALAGEIASAETAYADALVAEAAAHEERREWNDAATKFSQALRHLSGGRRDDVRALVDGLDGRSKLEDLIASAERDAAAKRWRRAWDAVGKARRSGMKDARIDGLARAAASELAPAKRFVGPLGLEYVLVRGGSFRMGSADGEPDERPVHGVAVSSFYIGCHEVTRSQFEAFRKGRGTQAAGAADGRPVGSVSWQSAVDMCRYLSSIDPEGATYRLPTEAEWEYAARGPGRRKYPWGDRAPTPERLNALVGGAGSGKPSDVGAHPAGDTPSGISDMAGNVFEWCADWYGPYPAAARDNPVGPATGTKRVARGGAYGLDAGASRSALRGTRPPESPLALIGFRVVRALTEEEKVFERLAGEW